MVAYFVVDKEVKVVMVEVAELEQYFSFAKLNIHDMEVKVLELEHLLKMVYYYHYLYLLVLLVLLFVLLYIHIDSHKDIDCCCSGSFYIIIYSKRVL